MSVRLPGVEYEALRELARLDGVLFADYVRALVRRHVLDRSVVLPPEVAQRFREGVSMDRHQLEHRLAAAKESDEAVGTVVLSIEASELPHLAGLEGAQISAPQNFDGAELVQAIVPMTAENSLVLSEVLVSQLNHRKRFRLGYKGIEYEGELQRLEAEHIARVVALALQGMLRGEEPDFDALAERARTSSA